MAKTFHRGAPGEVQMDSPVEQLISREIQERAGAAGPENEPERRFDLRVSSTVALVLIPEIAAAPVTRLMPN